MEQNNKPKLDFGKMAVIALKLLVICGAIALLVAGVYHLTKDKIALNTMNDTAASLSTIYEADGLVFSVEGDKGAYTYAMKNQSGENAGTLTEEDKTVLDAEAYKNIDTVYTVKDTADAVLGYCVMASPMGFKDEVSMIVAVNPDITVKAVSIVAHSETSGIGSKAAEPAHLANFKGKAAHFTDTDLSKPIIISGATRTSKPVALAVDEALNAVNVIVNGEEAADNE